MSKVLITGGTGLLGKALTKKLLSAGHPVVLLSRSAKSSSVPGVSTFTWNVNKGEMDPEALHGVEYVVHLAGSGIADHRWTDAVKQEVLASRIKSMQLLESEIRKQGIRLKAFTGGSAVGYYGMVTSYHTFKENDKPATSDFLVQCCQAWENTYAHANEFSEKHCVIRIGVVLSKDGGALKRMIPVFQWGLGSPIGSGRQYMPWVHIDDMSEILFQSLFNPAMQGIYNAASPEPVRNREFSKQLAKALRRPFIAPAVPAFVLRAMFGEMGNVVLEGSAVDVKRLLEAGFVFQYPSLEKALAYELNRP